MIASIEYKSSWHDQVCRIIHLQLCEKWDFHREKKWENLIKSLSQKHARCGIFQYKRIRNWTGHLDWRSNRKKKCDTSHPFDSTKRNQLWVIELWTWKALEVEEIAIIKVVIGTFGMVTNRIETRIKKIGIDRLLELLQRENLFGTARIIRKVRNT